MTRLQMGTNIHLTHEIHNKKSLNILQIIDF